MCFQSIVDREAEENRETEGKTRSCSIHLLACNQYHPRSISIVN